jgi:N-methylhydantoinase A
MSIVAIDIGGTFTDLASLDPATGQLRFSKSLTTPPNFEQGALDCVRKANLKAGDIDILRHGTTVVINALLEHKGARTALVTTEGFRDMLEIGRGNRPEGFNLLYERLPPVVPRHLRFGVPGRMDSRGNVLKPLDMEVLAQIAAQIRDAKIEAVGICFMHSWRNPQHEIEAGEYLRKNTNCFVSCSHEISREFREFERTTTTALNAYVGPNVAQYLARFGNTLRGDGFDGRLFLMGSNGGVLTEEDTAHRPLLLVESGPVGGAAGAAEIGMQAGLKNLVAFDMGGTTAKAVLIENGEASVSPLYWVGGYDRGYPVQAAVLDIVEVGAGGGSIAGVNELGAMQVGPRSASAVPGPACYDQGGTEPTVTDANLYLGRLHADHFLGGAMKLRTDLAEQALGRLAKTLDQPVTDLAAGILRIATMNMATAVRRVTIERGYDPRDFAMVAFGGAGPLHAVAVAREIGMNRVVIPPQPGHFSAYGMLFADFRYDLTETVVSLLDAADLKEIDQRFGAMETAGKKQIEQMSVPIKSIRFIRYAEMRYRRQEHTIKIRLPEKAFDKKELGQLFEDTYKHRFGHASNMEIEMVMLRLVIEGRTVRPELARSLNGKTPAAIPKPRRIWFEETGFVECNAWQRTELVRGQTIEGPGVIEEEASTTVLTPGDSAELDHMGNIVITLGSRA